MSRLRGKSCNSCCYDAETSSHGSSRFSTNTRDRWRTLRISNWSRSRRTLHSDLRVRVTTKAKENSLRLDGEIVRVYTTSPPVDGSANKSVVQIVAKALKVPKSAVAIKRGLKSRDKLLHIANLDPAELKQRLKGL
ncbi:MAG: DUF167 domain-containing protein [Armatimonadetes bacterium]|nr:DUF167 domain-containing protein [Armatimonadota bacterium]